MGSGAPLVARSDAVGYTGGQKSALDKVATPGPLLIDQGAPFDAEDDALGRMASFPHARARAHGEARQRHERALRHFSYLSLIEMGPRKTSCSTPFGRACRPSSVTSSRATRQAAPELLFLTVGRGKPPAPPAHFSTYRMSCFFASSCAAALLGSLIHQALPSLTITNACLLLVLASASKKPSLFSLTATWFDFPPLCRSGPCLSP